MTDHPLCARTVLRCALSTTILLMDNETPTTNLDLFSFAELVGVKPWPKMREIFQAVADGKRKILVRSCNGAGKTTAIAALCNWKLSQFTEAIVLTTASSWTQVRRTLW